MKTDLNQFTGRLPYATEMFGTYQPLTGWKSRLATERLSLQRRNIISSINTKLIGRSPQKNVTLRPEAITRDRTTFAGSESTASNRITIAPEIDSVLARTLALQISGKSKDLVSEVLKLVKDNSIEKRIAESKAIIQSVVSNQTKSVAGEVAGYIKFHFQNTGVTQENLNRREEIVSSYLNWLAQNKPSLLNDLFYKGDDAASEAAVRSFDVLGELADEGYQPLLSPIGVIHLFRQYFFEFDSFLGPPVSHFWVPAGGTVELIEIHSRRVVEERTAETTVEATLKTELESKNTDELSDAIKDENQTDVKLGFTGSIKYSVPTFEGAAGTSLDLNNSKSSARETTHKRLREQSEKLSSEIKKNFKTTFKVSSESEDSSSKRYVIQNTSDKLLNYELKRKMRRIGIQLQDMGTQMCWQVYVDNPGNELGISELVHVASPPNLSNLTPPAAPVLQEMKTVESTVQFPYEAAPGSEGSNLRQTYYDGDDRDSGKVFHDNKIIYIREYHIQPPAPGYTMNMQINISTRHTGIAATEISGADATGKFKIILHEVNFKNHPSIDFTVTTTWSPPDQTNVIKEYEEQMKTFTEEQQQKTNEALVVAARDRIRLSSSIRSRSFNDLREEERMVIYRMLMRQLLNIELTEDIHVVAELIESIFDVEHMLYFTAPEWWQPKKIVGSQSLGATPVTDDSRFNWGGGGRANNYYITEDSDPARMGSSLGWILQLDGDKFRNSFLNSPWVKTVLPVKAGKEIDAINWLTKAHVEGTAGLDADYIAPEEELKKIKPDGGKVTVRDAVIYFAKQVQELRKNESVVDEDSKSLPGEKVFENGFNPLDGSFKPNENPLNVFSQWTEILPSDQLVAVEYLADNQQ